MSKLTDLELCKKIAEIEWLSNNKYKWKVKTTKKGLIKIINQNGAVIFSDYNPIEDWNITGPLKIKHEIDDEKCHNKKIGYSATCGLIHETDLNLQRAICLAIVAKDEALK